MNLSDDSREGLTSMATTEDNISTVRLIIEIDKGMTHQQNWTSLGIGVNQVHKVFHEYLAVRKLCTRWIPNNLTDAQKLRRINYCREMMQRFAGGDLSAVYDIITAGIYLEFSVMIQQTDVGAGVTEWSRAQPNQDGNLRLYLARSFGGWLPAFVVFENSL
ncbi:hypothetical protein EVAR_62182_1 [Eumeta japonica]|uniref:Histone-lysine N-methyltransferase SETMAR n=1 Tax=Eumeta variegata TaxID=151549 RepID=A0A4C1Z5D3_EUMVA|nr:hypothetical protein EVAR_62182_1 [Eumeta japonica]